MLEGEVLTAAPGEVVARIANLDDAFLRFSTDDCAGTVHVWLWLATYGDTKGVDLDALQKSWDAKLEALFPERVAAGDVQPERATELSH